MASVQDKQEDYSGKHGRENIIMCNVDDLVLPYATNVPVNTVSTIENNKLEHRLI